MKIGFYITLNDVIFENKVNQLQHQTISRIIHTANSQLRSSIIEGKISENRTFALHEIEKCVMTINSLKKMCKCPIESRNKTIDSLLNSEE